MQIWCRCLLYVETVTSSRKCRLINAIPLVDGRLPHRMRNLLDLRQIGTIDCDFLQPLVKLTSTNPRFTKNFDRPRFAPEN